MKIPHSLTIGGELVLDKNQYSCYDRSIVRIVNREHTKHMAQATEKQIEFIKKLVAQLSDATKMIYNRNEPEGSYEHAVYKRQLEEQMSYARFFQLASIDYASLSSYDASKLISALKLFTLASQAVSEVYLSELENFFGAASTSYIDTPDTATLSNEPSPIVAFLRAVNWSR